MNTLLRRNRGQFCPTLTRNEALEQFMSPLDQVFDRFWNDIWGDQSILDKIKSTSAYPPVDIYRNDSDLILEAAVAGHTMEDLDIEWIEEERVLKLRGEKVVDHGSTKKDQYLVRENKLSSFTKIIEMPEFTSGTPTATIKNGILKLVWKDCYEVKKENIPKKIEVKEE